MPEQKSLQTFRRTKVSSAIRASLSLLALGAMSYHNPAFSQETEPADRSSQDSFDDGSRPIEEIITRGVRSSLESAQALKRNSSVIVDSVTAEDIGALPDRSVTETLQRIPGVAINRFAAGRDPDHFSVEGSGVVVRGLTYVRSEVNGRDSFTANNGRGLSFADVPPELLIGVDVFKSPSADRVEGGIAGTVNLRTRKPFDSQEPLFAFSLESSYADFVEETSPTGSALGSWRWDTDAGEFGVLGSVVYSQVQSRADRFQVSNFAERTLYSSGDVIDTGGGETPLDEVIFPRGAVMGTQEFDRERYGYSAAVQWRSPGDDMEATFQFLRSDSREAWSERVVEIATDVVADQGDSRAAPGTTFEFDASNLFDRGVITGPTGWRDDQFTGDPRTPSFGLQSNNIRRDVKQKFVTDDFGINFIWNVSEDWALSFDYQHVDSRVDNLDAGIWGSTYQNASIDLNGSDVPTVAFLPPILCTDTPSNTCATYFTGGHDSFTDPYNSFYRAAMDHVEESDGKSDAYRIDAERMLSDAGWLESVRFGYRFAERDQTARFSTYNWGSLSEIWGGGGPVWFDDPIASNGGQPLLGYEAFHFENFFRGDTSNPLGTEGRLFYADSIVDNYDAYAQYASQIGGEWGGASWVPLADRPGTTGWFVPGELNPVKETNNAVYLMTNFDTQFDNGWNLTGNIGVRYSDTKREASGFQTFQFQDFSTEEECAVVPPGEQPTPFCSLPLQVREDARAFANGAITPYKATLDDDHWLPSLNLKLEVAEGLQFRAAYFKGIAPPDFGLTRAYFNINLSALGPDIEAGGGRPIGRFNAGNPLLKPVVSDNYDVTAEWYFSEVGQLSVAFFHKELKNIRTNDIQRQTFTNNGATFDAIVTTAVNSRETGEIKGFEVAYQQTYDFLPGAMRGLGLSANYTYVDSSNVPQSTLSETDPDVAAGNQTSVDIGLLPLEGLSRHTINLAPFYDHEKWSARLAYSWRDEFLLTIRDVIVPFQPIMHESTGQLDGSIFFSVNDSWKVGVQGVNLLNETIRTSAIVNEALQTAP
ncbi:MAG TPA: TonB-dependent receptor, partial [Woeseiaceae bacterium]